MDKRDYYEVLGVSRGAGEADIKRAYRRLAKEFHPDHNKGNKQAEERFKEVQEAYDVLSDKDKRGRYDQFGHAGIDPRFAAAPEGVQWHVREGEGVDLSDFADVFNLGGGAGGHGGSIFEQFFSGGGSRVHATGTAPARDIETQVALSFDQALRGTTLELEHSNGPGSASQTISVRIPPGVQDGQRIRVKGKGQPGKGRRPPGDLHVICRVQPHPYFRRVEDDICIEAPITIAEAALGAKIDIPTIDGERTVSVPPGTSSGAKLRLAGLGVPNPRTGERGHQFVVIKIVAPANLTSSQRDLLEELNRTGLGSPRAGLWR